MIHPNLKLLGNCDLHNNYKDYTNYKNLEIELYFTKLNIKFSKYSLLYRNQFNENII